MKMLMFGRGVISALYGGVLAEAGHEVQFFVREGRSSVLGGGVALNLIDMRRPPVRRRVLTERTLACVESLDALDGVDIVIVSVRHDQMREAAEQLRSAPMPRLGILLFNNCWEDPASISESLGARAALWGFPVAGGQFNDDRHLVGALMPSIHLAAADSANTALHAEVVALFESAKIKVAVRRDFRTWLWLHFAVNAAMIAQAISAAETAAQLVSSARQLAEAARLAREAVGVVAARGGNPKAHRSETAIVAMPPLLAGLLIKSLAAWSPAARRLMMLHGNERHLARFPLDVLAEADRLGVPCPRLAAVRPRALAILAGDKPDQEPSR